MYNLVPVLDETVPTGCSHFAWFVRMPKHADANVVVGFPFLEKTRCFPVPHICFTIRVSRYQITVKKKK